MAYPNPPRNWVHTWLRPLYDWLVGLNLVAGSTSSYTSGSRPTPASTGATPTNRVMLINPDTNTIETTDGMNWYDVNGNLT